MPCDTLPTVGAKHLHHSNSNYRAVPANASPLRRWGIGGATIGHRRRNDRASAAQRLGMATDDADNTESTAVIRCGSIHSTNIKETY
jgi:hypothetical protein